MLCVCRIGHIGREDFLYALSVLEAHTSDWVVEYKDGKTKGKLEMKAKRRADVPERRARPGLGGRRLASESGRCPFPSACRCGSMRSRC